MKKVKQKHGFLKPYQDKDYSLRLCSTESFTMTTPFFEKEKNFKSFNLPQVEISCKKSLERVFILIMISFVAMMAASFNMKAHAISGNYFSNASDVSSIDQINDNTVQNVKIETDKAKPLDIDSLREYLKNAKSMDKEMLRIGQDFNAFADNAKINLTLDEIDVQTALKIIAKEGGKNIIIDESVQGYISADLKGTSLNEAMKIILISEELEARVEDSTIFIASRPAMSKKGLNRKYVKAFKLNNANAVEVSKVLEASIFNKGYNVNEEIASQMASQTALPSMQVGESENKVPAQSTVASTGQSTLSSNKVIKGRVEELTSGEGFGDAKILASEIKIQHKKVKTKNISIDNNDGGAIVIPDTRSNSVLVAGLKNEITLAENAIKYLDKPLDQVEINVSLVELNKDNISDLGVSFSGDGGHFDTGFDSNAKNQLHGLNTDKNQGVITYTKLDKSVLDNFYIRLNALLENKKAKLLANPTIMALDNSESLIKITDQVVSKMEVVVTQTTTTYDVTLADVGIVLNILPKIGKNGFVTMKVRPSITTPLGEKPVGTFGAFVTPISTREVIIEDVRVKSGETLAIAGLIKESDVEKVGKVPVLGDLPLIGKLFTTKEYDRNKTELVILITPKIKQEYEFN